MPSRYFVIVPSEDGARIYPMDEEELLEKLNEGYWGDMNFAGDLPYENMPNGTKKYVNDPNYWRFTAIIIKGEVVQPKEKTTVKEWTL